MDDESDRSVATITLIIHTHLVTYHNYDIDDVHYVCTSVCTYTHTHVCTSAHMGARVGVHTWEVMLGVMFISIC